MNEREFPDKIEVSVVGKNLRLKGDRDEGTYPPWIEVATSLKILSGKKELLNYKVPKGKKLVARIVLKGELVKK